MTKTISIYAAQILLGVIAIAAGYAKLTGAGLMVQQFQALGLGQGFLMVAGLRRNRRRPLPAAAARRHPRRGAADLRDGRRARRHHRPCRQRRRAAGRRPLTATISSHRSPAATTPASIQIFRHRTEWDI